MILGKSQTRRVVLAAGGALLALYVARAQPAKRRLIAYLAPGTLAIAERHLAVFREGLRALGYGDEDIATEVRYADGHTERLPDLAAELVRLVPDVIIAGSPPATKALATSTIPIVMGVAVDPVAAGFVASLAHPGGN